MSKELYSCSLCHGVINNTCFVRERYKVAYCPTCLYTYFFVRYPIKDAGHTSKCSTCPDYLRCMTLEIAGGK